MTHTDYCVNPLYLNSGIEAWKGVEWADSYWQQAPVGLSGRPINGTFITKLDVTFHTDVFKWYIKTIQDEASKEGYYYSAIGGGVEHRPEISGQPHPPKFDFLSESIFNGDFRFAPPVSNRAPGWFHHGGNGAGHIESGELELDRGNGEKRHDRFYIPKEAKQLVFDYRTHNADGYKRNGVDHLAVSINDRVMIKLSLEETQDAFQEHSINIEKFGGSVAALSFRIVDEHANQVFINSEVKIDNVRLR